MSHDQMMDIEVLLPAETIGPEPAGICRWLARNAGATGGHVVLHMRLPESSDLGELKRRMAADPAYKVILIRRAPPS